LAYHLHRPALGEPQNSSLRLGRFSGCKSARQGIVQRLTCSDALQAASGQIKKPQPWSVAAGSGNSLEQSCYSTISFSPHSRFQQQQQAQVRRSWQPSIMMPLFIVRFRSRSQYRPIHKNACRREYERECRVEIQFPLAHVALIRLSEAVRKLDVFELRFNDN
jgi:hypothetical protein